MTTTTSRNRALAAATSYIEAMGWALVEIEPGLKGPRRPGWNAPGGPILTVANALATWGHRPMWGMGLVHGPSRTCALDVDDVDAARVALARYRLDLDRLLAASAGIESGRPGRAKALYAIPRDLDTLPAHRLMHQGRVVVELRAGLLQDVLPPTVHPDTGRPYKWRGRPEDVTELPEPLAMLWLNGPGPEPAAAPDSPDGPIAEGGRNHALFRLGCAMRRHGAPAGVIEAALLATNAERCAPPLAEAEVRRTAESAARYLPVRQPTGDAPAAAYPGVTIRTRAGR